MAGEVVDMLSLNEQKPFAVGGRRACYVHPHHRNRCIKILLADKRPDHLRDAAAWWKRIHRNEYYDENIQDLRIDRYLRSRHGDAIYQHLPRVFGMVQTDLGDGLEVELIRDSDGKISLSGKGYVIEQGLPRALLESVDALKVFLIKHRIQFRDPFPHNLSVQVGKNNDLRPFIVDGLARKSWPPFDRLPRSVSEPRIRKKMQRLVQGLKRTEENRKAKVTPKQKGLLLKR